MTDQTKETVNQQQETVTKQKNPLRIEQGKRLVEYNCRGKKELKRLNEQTTKQDDMVEHKPVELSNNYLARRSLCEIINSTLGMSFIDG